MKRLNAIMMSVLMVIGSVGNAGSVSSAGTNGDSSSGTAVKPKGLLSNTSNGSINDNASNSNKQNTIGMITNAGMGAANLAMAKSCYSQCTPNEGCCSMAGVFLMMGVQNLAQAAAQLATAKQAGGNYAATDIGGAYGGDSGLGGSSYDPDAVKQLTDAVPELKSGTDFLGSISQPGATGPLTFNPKTGTATTADGKKITAKDVNSNAALSALGLSGADISKLGSMEQKMLADAQKKAEKKGLATNVLGDEGGSGGGSGSGSGSSSGAGSMAAYGTGLGGGAKGLGVDRDPAAQVAGMQKNYNGEPIGVAGDSIFGMMTRRYKVKEGQSSFLDESEAPMQK